MEDVQNVSEIEFSSGIGFLPEEKYNKMTLGDLYDFVSDEQNESKFQLLRSNDDRITPEEKAEIKKKLPWVTLSGVFTGNRKANKFNPEKVTLVQADFDHIPDTNGLKKVLEKLPCVAMTFISPSGTGVKAIVHVENGCSDFSRIWSYVSSFLKEKTGFEIDNATKDISRLMFLSYDADCYKNYSTVPLNIAQVFEKNGLNMSQQRTKFVSKINADDSLIKVESAMNYISCEDYQTWLHVGMSLHNSFFASEEAKELWSDWSRQSVKFNQKDIDLKWNTFENYSRQPLTIATIFKLAIEKGWKNTKIIDKQVLTIEDCSEIEQSGIKSIKNDWYFCSKTNAIINKNTFEELTGVGRDSLIKSTCGAKSFNFAIHQMERIYDTVHWWGYEKVVTFENKKLFSKWRQFSPKNEVVLNDNYENGDALKALQTFLKINYDEEELFLKWIACCVHGGLKKPDFGLALYGDKGSGKGIVFDIIRLLIGVENTCMRTPKQVESQFNGDFEGKRLIFYDEIVTGKKEQLDFQNDMKDKITSSFLKVRAMRKDQYVVPGHIMYMMATNDAQGFPIEPNDGRWLVLETKIEVKNRNIVKEDDKKIVDEMWNVLKNYAGNLFEELKSIDFNDLPRNAPETKYQLKVVGMKTCYTEEIVAEYVNEEMECGCAFIKSSKFQDWMNLNNRKVNNNDLQKCFAKFNFVKSKKTIDGKEFRGWEKK